MRTAHVDRHEKTVVGIHAKSSDSSFFSLIYILSLCRKEDIDMKQKVLTWLMIVTAIIGIVTNVLRISIYKEELK